jgi:MoaA/NifB/PqqE/SkfB family radical SAM enzyme
MIYKTQAMNDNVSNGSSQIRSIKKMFLWLNSGCNAKCKSCDIWREEIGHNLTFEEIKNWLPGWNALALQTIVICGEPLLYADVWDILGEIKKYGIKIELLTNGILLERHAANVTKFANELRVSLDGPEKIHNYSRGRPNAFDKLRRGVEAVRSHVPGFSIGGRCHINKQNFRFLRETVETARSLGLSFISFSGTDFSNEEPFRRVNTITASYGNSFAIRGEDLLELEADLKRFYVEHAADFASGFISDSPEKLNSLLVEYYRDLNDGARRTIRCNAPWTSVVLEYNGVVRPCFPMPAYGNLKDHGSLSEALNSLCATNFREGLDVSSNPICRNCACPEVNPM